MKRVFIPMCMLLYSMALFAPCDVVYWLNRACDAKSKQSKQKPIVLDPKELDRALKTDPNPAAEQIAAFVEQKERVADHK